MHKNVVCGQFAEYRIFKLKVLGTNFNVSQEVERTLFNAVFSHNKNGRSYKCKSFLNATFIE